MKIEQLGLNVDERPVWEAWQLGRLELKACSACSQITHPPLPMCSTCGATSWTLVTPATTGQVHSWITAAPTAPGCKARIIALVELRDGTRVVTNVIGAGLSSEDPAVAIANDMEVTLYLGEQDGLRLLLCRPLGQQL